MFRSPPSGEKRAALASIIPAFRGVTKKLDQLEKITR